MALKPAIKRPSNDTGNEGGGGFRRADTPVRRRLICASDGLEKSGKDHFALTAPGPIYLFSFDEGLEGVVQKFQDKKEIWYKEYRVPRPRNATEAKTDVMMGRAAEVWDQFAADYEFAMGKARTVIIDTGTELWELLRLARFGKTTQVKPHHYGPVNAEYRSVIRDAYSNQRDVNLLILHKVKNEYVDDRRTGGLERAGFSETGYLVQVNLHHWRDEKSGQFVVTVGDCRHNPEAKGEELRQEMATFQMLAMTVMPDADPADWEE